MAAAKSQSKVRVRVLLDAVHGDHGHFYQGQEYDVDKAAASWLLEDERVAVPVKSTGRSETATEE